MFFFTKADEVIIVILCRCRVQTIWKWKVTAAAAATTTITKIEIKYRDQKIDNTHVLLGVEYEYRCLLCFFDMTFSRSLSLLLYILILRGWLEFYWNAFALWKLATTNLSRAHITHKQQQCRRYKKAIGKSESNWSEEWHWTREGEAFPSSRAAQIDRVKIYINQLKRREETRPYRIINNNNN